MQSDDVVPVSALQHWCYCPRQCALIHVEQSFAENVHTLRGSAVHKAVDVAGFEERAGCRSERALPIWSDRLGLVGKADVVEFARDGSPYPVEFKRGSRDKQPWIAQCDALQLAAQAVCLEEMTGKAVPEGAIYFAASRRRRVVQISSHLRLRVAEVTGHVRAMLVDARLPAPIADTRCRECSLVDICQPHAADRLRNDGQRMRATLFDPDA